ncbi:MAG TPA: hypothetical protein VMV95_03215 [Bacillota bacterium]|nr:hypothetical protein [Bacillota bacterium]
MGAKAIKNAIVAGAIVGALAGSQTINLLDSYEKALNSARYATKTEMVTYEKAFKKDSSLKDNPVLSEGYKEALKDHERVSTRLEKYQQAGDAKKTGMVASDFKRYGLTAKSFKPAVPLSKEGAKKTGTGAVGGATVGLGALGAWKIRKKRRSNRRR